MNVYHYKTAGGKDLILDYIYSLSKAEIIDGISVLEKFEKDDIDTLVIKPWQGGKHMPFEKVNISATIDEALCNDSELKHMWENSRMEYTILGELIKIRKAHGLTQAELAENAGIKQQVISRIENKENSPTLKTICSLLNAMDYEIQLVPRQQHV
ncbi:MAG: helix-turn-helix domain-containing protein [Defluviitaleaceae bacterium]|nr:helix-turn-helix domain-containing protein [Defluviitaleaceae bacterium]